MNYQLKTFLNKKEGSITMFHNERELAVVRFSNDRTQLIINELIVQPSAVGKGVCDELISLIALRAFRSGKAIYTSCHFIRRMLYRNFCYQTLIKKNNFNASIKHENERI